MNAQAQPVDVPTHASAVRYWTNAARENSRWFVQLRRAYRAEKHAHRRARLWSEGSRCRNRIAYLMAEARAVRAVLAGGPSHG